MGGQESTANSVLNLWLIYRPRIVASCGLACAGEPLVEALGNRFHQVNDLMNK